LKNSDSGWVRETRSREDVEKAIAYDDKKNKNVLEGREKKKGIATHGEEGDSKKSKNQRKGSK